MSISAQKLNDEEMRREYKEKLCEKKTDEFVIQLKKSGCEQVGRQPQKIPYIRNHINKV